MGTRLELQALLESLADPIHVYFQPPVNTQLEYPAVVYLRDQESVTFADNNPYFHKRRYQLTVIDSDPDGDLPDIVTLQPLTRFVRSYTTQGLYHYIYNMYF